MSEPERAARRVALAIPTPADLPAIYRIALLADEPGRKANAAYQDPDLIGHVYAGPYVLADATACRVLRRGSRDVGFCVATADTLGFGRWCEELWWPALRDRYPAPEPQDSTADASTVRLIHTPAPTPDAIVATHPAHLHVNLLPEAQGSGGGRAMMEAVHTELAGRGVAAVHLGVDLRNSPAIGFYAHLGYGPLQSTGDTMFMGLRLD